MLSLKKNKRAVSGGFIGMTVATILVAIILVIFGMLSSVVKQVGFGDGCVGQSSGSTLCIENSSEMEMVDYAILYDLLVSQRSNVNDEMLELGVVHLFYSKERGGEINGEFYDKVYFTNVTGEWMWTYDLIEWYEFGSNNINVVSTPMVGFSYLHREYKRNGEDVFVQALGRLLRKDYEGLNMNVRVEIVEVRYE